MLFYWFGTSFSWFLLRYMSSMFLALPIFQPVTRIIRKKSCSRAWKYKLFSKVSTWKLGFGFWKWCGELGLRLSFTFCQIFARFAMMFQRGEAWRHCETLKNPQIWVDKNLAKYEEKPFSPCLFFSCSRANAINPYKISINYYCVQKIYDVQQSDWGKMTRERHDY